MAELNTLSALLADAVAYYRLNNAVALDQTSIPTTNLKAYYKFDSGALTTDSSGNGHTLTNQTAVTETTGRIDGGASFNGSHYMYTANTTALNITGSITVGCWVKLNAVAEKGLISKGLHADTTFQWALRVSSTSKFAFGVDNDGSWGPVADAVGSTTPSTGVWYHVVGVYNGSTVKVYLNGVENGSVSYSGGIISKTGNVYIGTFFDTSYLINATIDEAFIYDTALTASQIAEIYALGYDSSGNGYNLTNVNTVAEATGKYGGGADGGATNSTKYLWINNNLGIDGGACSISLWVKMNTEIGSGTQTFVSQQNTNTDTSFMITYDYNGGTRRIAFRRYRQGVAADENYYTITLGTSAFQHLVLTYDATNLRGYVNGTLQAGPTAFSGNGTGVTSEHLAILTNKGGAGTPSEYASALVDDVAIFNRALTEAEVTSLYEAGSTGNFFMFF